MNYFKGIKAAFILLAAGVLILSGCKNENKPAVNGDKLREYAGALINKSLYPQAIREYQRYLDEYDIDSRERANVNYIIANTYFNRVKDYQQALAYYLKIKHLYPESSLMEEVNKKIVACLERLEKTEDARQALDETVQYDQSKVQKKRPGEVIAKIGKREITQGDLDFEISQLPPSVRDQFRSREQKLAFLRDYVATDLLYSTAKRAGLDKDKDVIEGAFQAKKSLMVRKLLEERVANKVKIEDSDIQLYYDAHKDDYAEKDKDGNIVREKPLSEVRQQVAQDLSRKKYLDEYQALIERMIMVENVKFYENRIK